MSKYYTIPFNVVGESEPRLSLILPELGATVLPSPNWFVPLSHVVESVIEPDQIWQHLSDDDRES